MTTSHHTHHGPSYHQDSPRSLQQLPCFYACPPHPTPIQSTPHMVATEILLKKLSQVTSFLCSDPSMASQLRARLYSVFSTFCEQYPPLAQPQPCLTTLPCLYSIQPYQFFIRSTGTIHLKCLCIHYFLFLVCSSDRYLSTWVFPYISFSSLLKCYLNL